MNTLQLELTIMAAGTACGEILSLEGVVMDWDSTDASRSTLKSVGLIHELSVCGSLFDFLHGEQESLEMYDLLFLFIITYIV